MTLSDMNIYTILSAFISVIASDRLSVVLFWVCTFSSNNQHH